MGETILIVDDDLSILEVLDARLGAWGFRVLKADSAGKARAILKKEAVDLMVSDVKMPGTSGPELFAKIRGDFPHLPVIFLTAYGTIPDAVAAVKNGAVDYISKPFDGRELIQKLESVLAPGRREEDFEGEYYWGESPAMERLYSMVTKVAATQVNVLILGESGVGKECIARYIHQHSPRTASPYVIVDCGATPTGILESELFGHLKGSFTHAVKDKTGLIQSADKGTLFLDEIGNISHDMQCRLLRFLEEGRVRQVGSVTDKMVDVRVVAATNANLPHEIEEGRFRQDLYYRLKGITLTIPPLRDRRQDIPVLAQFFVDQYARAQGVEPIGIADETMEILMAHSWPGNIRELKHAIEAGAILCQNRLIRPEDLQIDAPVETNPPSSDDFSIEESEKQTLIRALKQTRGVQKHAADLLNISKRAMHYKVKKYNIQPAAFK